MKIENLSQPAIDSLYRTTVQRIESVAAAVAAHPLSRELVKGVAHARMEILRIRRGVHPEVKPEVLVGEETAEDLRREIERHEEEIKP